MTTAKTIAAGAVVFLAAAAGLAASHPRNARAAAECVKLFRDDGKPEEARFFADLAGQEGFAQAQELLVPPPMSAAELRVKLTPRNAWDLMPQVRAAGEAFTIEVARRALDMHWPKIAAGYASLALGFGPKPELAPFFLACARAFTPREPILAQESLRLAIMADPSLARTYRLPPVRSLFGGCGVITSPFAEGPFNSDERLFPGAIVPPRPRPARASPREARCLALPPALFPEPFEAARDQAVLIGGPDIATIEQLPASPCIEQSTWDLVIDRDGHVERMKVRLAAFSGAGNHDPVAIDTEQKRIEPLVMQQTFRPPTVRGVPVRSESWGGALRDCARRQVTQHPALSTQHSAQGISE